MHFQLLTYNCQNNDYLDYGIAKTITEILIICRYRNGRRLWNDPKGQNFPGKQPAEHRDSWGYSSSGSRSHFGEERNVCLGHRKVEKRVDHRRRRIRMATFGNQKRCCWLAIRKWNWQDCEGTLVEWVDSEKYLCLKIITDLSIKLEFKCNSSYFLRRICFFFFLIHIKIFIKIILCIGKTNKNWPELKNWFLVKTVYQNYFFHTPVRQLTNPYGTN